MPTRRILASLATALCLASTAPAQTLLRDFNTTPSTVPGHANPGSFQPLPGGRLLFTMSTLASGAELWVTDGTQANSALIGDLQPGPLGSAPRSFVEVTPGVYVFTATTTAEGWELWRTDGTSAGTYLLKDIWPGPENSVAIGLTKVGNQVVFFANDGAHGIEPWRTDGTAAGTQMILDVVPGPGGMSNGTAEIVRRGAGRFSFTALINQQWQLWDSDGTAGGTTPVYSFQAYYIFGPSRLTTFGNLVLFEARDVTNDDTLWVSDGTPAGTQSLGVYHQGYVQLAGGVAYFRGYDAATGVELWRTDGTVAGTSMVVELLPGGSFGGNGDPWLVGALQGDVLFFGSAPTGRQLFRSDGTAAGTVAISSIAPNGTFYGANWGVPVNGELWFQIPSGYASPGLYSTDGTAAGTQLVTTLDTIGVAPVGNTVILSGDDGTQIGRELYTTDGTPGGTQLFWDIVPAPVSISSYPKVLGTFRDRAIVQAEDAATGRELWLTDGTPAGTQLLADLQPGPGNFGFGGVAANDRQIMICGESTAADGDPWFSDGTTAGTQQLDLLPANSGFRAVRPAAFGDRFVFVGGLPGFGEEPWVTDGTVAGTFALADIAPGTASSTPDRFRPIGDRMLFIAYGNGRELWSTDGTPAGTVYLTTVQTQFGGYIAWNPSEHDGYVWFANDTPGQGVELWRTDGTPAGTGPVLDLEPGPGSSDPHLRASLGAFQLIVATIGGAPRIVATDGTPTGTALLSLTAPEFIALRAFGDGQALIVTNDPWTNEQLVYRTDGSDAGTVLVGDYRVYGWASTTTPGEERVLITMDDGSTGQELYSTDGTASGTFAMFDMSPGDAVPRDVTRVGDRLVFSADDGIHGNELFSVRFASTADWAVDTYGSGCPGTGGVTPTIALGGVARVAPGTPFTLEMSDALPSSLALLAWSRGRAAAAVPGCTVWLDDPVEFAFASIDPTGAANLPIAPIPALVGARFDAQYFALDPQGSALGFLSSTGGLEFVVGM